MPARRRAPSRAPGSLGPEVDALEHERAQREHASPTSADWRTSSTPSEESTMSANEPIDPRGAGRAEECDLRVREVVLGEKPVAHGVVDVVVDGGRRGRRGGRSSPRASRSRSPVREDAVAGLVSEIERARDPVGVLAVPEATAEALAEHVVERVLARVPEGRVPHVVPEPDRLGGPRSTAARATTREIAVVSRVWVMRVR